MDPTECPSEREFNQDMQSWLP